MGYSEQDTPLFMDVCEFFFQPYSGEIMKSKFLFVVLCAMAVLTAGCNTIEGAVKNIERGGEKIQGAAKRN